MIFREKSTYLVLLISILLLSSGCQTEGREKNRTVAPVRSDEKKAPYRLSPTLEIVKYEAGDITPRSWLFHYERLDHPELKILRENEGLEVMVKDAESDLGKALLLSDWTNSQWKQGVPDPYPPWNANTILKMARDTGNGGFCAQYAVVFVQACLSMGIQARYVDLNSGKVGDSGHFSAEVWSSDLDKWVAVDPFYNRYFKSEGKPLGALEIHQQIAMGKAEKISVIKGNGKNADANTGSTSIKNIIDHYRQLAVDMRTDHLSSPQHFWDRRATYLSWKDEITDGRPDIFRLIVSDTEEFNFSMNRVQVMVQQQSRPKNILLMLRTNTPGLEGIEVKYGDESDWSSLPGLFYKDGKDIEKALVTNTHGSVIPLFYTIHKGNNELYFRSVNSRGVKGHPTYINISYSPDN